MFVIHILMVRIMIKKYPNVDGTVKFYIWIMLTHSEYNNRQIYCREFIKGIFWRILLNVKGSSRIFWDSLIWNFFFSKFQFQFKKNFGMIFEGGHVLVVFRTVLYLWYLSRVPFCHGNVLYFQKLIMTFFLTRKTVNLTQNS